MSAQTATIDLTAQSYTNAQEVTTLTVDGFTITFDKGSNQNAPKYYTSGNAVRTYGGNTFTISSDKTIVAISFTFASGEGTNEITVDAGTFADTSWTGSASSITFTIGGTSGHRRIQSIEITYEA